MVQNDKGIWKLFGVTIWVTWERWLNIHTFLIGEGHHLKPASRRQWLHNNFHHIKSAVRF